MLVKMETSVILCTSLIEWFLASVGVRAFHPHDSQVSLEVSKLSMKARSSLPIDFSVYPNAIKRRA
jgi:hypothetical protein